MVGRVVVFERLGDALMGICTDADGPWLTIDVDADWYAVRRDEVLAVVVGTGRPVTTVVRDDDWPWNGDE